MLCAHANLAQLRPPRSAAATRKAIALSIGPGRNKTNPLFLRLATQANLTGFSDCAGRAVSVCRFPQAGYGQPSHFLQARFRPRIVRIELATSVSWHECYRTARSRRGPFVCPPGPLATEGHPAASEGQLAHIPGMVAGNRFQRR